MGMDVYGEKPTSEVGEYFRNNVWWWRPLADYCLQTCEVAKRCKTWYTNDGGGLKAYNANLLADALEVEVTSGRTLQYEQKYKAYHESIPREPCRICGATGKRVAPPNIGPGDIHCNGCNGQGTCEAFETWYHFSVENVKEFIKFLRASGGFRIC